MKNLKAFFALRIFKILKWAILILAGLFIVLVIVRVPHYINAQKTQDQILKIHNTKLSVDDVMGKNLPRDPGEEADKTVQGIDSNFNGIRDDVELAVFKEYPNSAKTRAVLLQYALVLQMMATQPFVNEEIATEVIRDQSRGFSCVGELFSNKESDESYKNLLSLISIVENKQFNTEERKDYQKNFLNNVRSFSDIDGGCDIDLLNWEN